MDIANEIQRVISVIGVDGDWALTSGETFTIKMAPRYRRNDPLTGGSSQELDILSIAYADWQGRDPEKGDQVTVNGHKYTVQESRLVSFSNKPQGYRVQVKG